jgi:hypothetical protein
MENTMNYEKFKSDLKELLKTELANRGIDVEEINEEKIEKMNESYDSIVIKPAGASIATIIHVEDAFEAYKSGTELREMILGAREEDAELKGMVKSIADDIENEPQFDLSIFDDYKKVKSRLSMQIVSAERNAELLEDVPHERIEDMAVVYRVLMTQPSTGSKTATTLVTNGMLKKYGITDSQLKRDAMRNAPNVKPVKIRDMSETVKDFDLELAPDVSVEDGRIFVASVTDNLYGAAVIAYPNFLNTVAAMLRSDFFVLPSSIHEIIIIRDDGDLDADDLKNLVTSVNAAQVDPADQLTDNVYHYDMYNNVFEMVGSQPMVN